MKYERLTEKAIGCFGYDLKNFEHKPKEFNDYDAFYAYKTAVGRLGELEDKIEGGEIDYVAYKDKEIARLTAENAELRATLSKMETVEKELRERLKKAVELPTIYEQTIYPFIESLYTETIYYVVYKENGRIVTINCGKNKSTAEARLKELKENNND